MTIKKHHNFKRLRTTGDPIQNRRMFRMSGPSNELLGALEPFIAELLNCAPVRAIILTRALELLFEHLCNLSSSVARVSGKGNPTDTEIVNVLAKLETEREAYFRISGFHGKFHDSDYGRNPTAEASLGINWNKERYVKVLTKKLEKLAQKLEIEMEGDDI